MWSVEKIEEQKIEYDNSGNLSVMEMTMNELTNGPKIY